MTVHAGRAYYMEADDHFKAVEVIVYAPGYNEFNADQIVDFPHGSLFSREQAERHIRYSMELARGAPDESALCANCMDPGHCCRTFTLNLPFPLGTPRDVVAKLVKEAVGAPFTPLAQAHDIDVPPGKAIWTFSCPNLQASGKCGIYENRPDFCRNFKAGSAPLCVHYAPAKVSDEAHPQS